MATTKLHVRQTKNLELHPVSVEIGFIARWHSFKSRFTGSPSTDTRQGNAFDTEKVWTKPESRRPDSPHGIGLNQAMNRMYTPYIPSLIVNPMALYTCYIIREIFLLTT